MRIFQASNDNDTKNQIRKIGIVEIVFGVICMILGITGLVLFERGAYSLTQTRRIETISNGMIQYINIPTTVSGTTVGIGIWSSLFTVIAGSLAVCVGSANSSKSTATAHMVLAILGAISEGIGFVVACVYTQAIYVVLGAASASIPIIICILSGTNFFLLITSSALACKINSCCSGETAPVVYVASEGEAVVTSQVKEPTSVVIQPKWTEN